MQSKGRLLVMDCHHQVFVTIAQIVHIHAILSLSHHHHLVVATLHMEHHHHHLLLADTLHMGHHHRRRHHRRHCLPTLHMEHHLHQQLKRFAHQLRFVLHVNTLQQHLTDMCPTATLLLHHRCFHVPLVLWFCC